MEEIKFQFPALGVLNQFLIGDTVLCTAIAEAMSVRQRSYIVSNFPELLIGHPIVRGVRSFDELPGNCKITDLTAAIQNMDGEGKEKHVLPGKFEVMCKAAGFQRSLDAPKLYMTAKEWGTVQELRKFFPEKPNIGVVLGSTHPMKNWAYTILAIKGLLKRGYNVFLFSDRLTKTSDFAIPAGCYHIIGRSLREMMCYIAMMDAMLGPDTGPMHVAGALKIPLVVICFKVFADLYEMYENCKVLDSDIFKMKRGITGVSVKTVVDALSSLVGVEKKPAVWSLPDTAMMAPKTHAYIRMRGFGDLLLSLPAIATARSLNGNKGHSYVYITSPGGKKILECCDMFDEIIAVDYDHGPAGLPLPPRGIDYGRFDTCANMINVVDFLAGSNSVARTELFARAINIDKCDYDAPGWKLTIPEEWKEAAWNILKRHGVHRNHRILAFQVDTKGRSRIWPKARQRELCGQIAKRGWKVVLLSDVKHTKYSKRAINLTGELSVTEYLGMIAICRVGLSSDSALIHIAGAIGKPALGLFGAVDPELRIAHYKTVRALVGKASCVPCNDWQKSNCSRKKKMPECMWNIKAHEVIRNIEELSKFAGARNG